MKDTILALQKELCNVQDMNMCYDRIALDHGSSDQTRAMLIESIFEQAKSGLIAAISQLQILEKQLY